MVTKTIAAKNKLETFSLHVHYPTKSSPHVHFPTSHTKNQFLALHW